MQGDTSRILVVEDDETLALGVRDNLVASGHEVEVAAEGTRGLEAARRGDFDLVILDVMLPGMDGYSICRNLRQDGNSVPILFLTARGYAEDRIRGLEEGGDDYLPKPFHLRELLLRVEALLRRGNGGDGATADPAEPLVFGGNRIDLRSHEARGWDGSEHELGLKEARILELLARRGGEVVEREEILDEVWGAEVRPSSRGLDRLIRRLRLRFEPRPEQPRYLHTVPGVGYKLTRQPPRTATSVSREAGGDGEGSPRPDAGSAPDARPVAREVTAELLARYDRPGPRYTSYPTAVEFHEGVDGAAYAKLLERADRAADEPLSIYVHLPFCESRCLFCGCHVIATPHHERALPYLDRLEREIDAVSGRLPNRRRLAQLHLGGGTPTYYEPAELSRLMESLLERFERSEDAELAVEVDPRVTTSAHLEALASHGFNRVSFGVQDLDPQVQEAIGRVQSRRRTEELVGTARELGFGGINVDLIYGLPHQRPDSFETTLEAVVELGADRVAVYSFAYVPWIRGHQKALDEEALPSTEVKFELFATAREKLLSSGYEPIGMDHFALPHDELAVARREHRLRRNFQGYTVLPASDSLGFGVSAIGDLAGGYVQNAKKLSTYEELLEADSLPIERGVLRSADDEARRQVIAELMCNFRVEMDEIEAAHGIDFEEYFAVDLERLAEHETEGLVRIEDRCIEATPVGELFVRNLAICFDRYWRERHQDGAERVFSRTV